VRRAKAARREGPLVQRLAAGAEWVLEALLGTGDVPVERH
jgi:hypothetical protein